jgi:hypothetical protein
MDAEQPTAEQAVYRQEMGKNRANGRLVITLHAVGGQSTPHER